MGIWELISTSERLGLLFKEDIISNQGRESRRNLKIFSEQRQSVFELKVN